MDKLLTVLFNIFVPYKLEEHMRSNDCLDLYEEIGGYLGLKQTINDLDLNVSSFTSDDLEGILSQLVAFKRGYVCL